jgi:hypothetical protein
MQPMKKLLLLLPLLLLGASRSHAQTKVQTSTLCSASFSGSTTCSITTSNVTAGNAFVGLIYGRGGSNPSTFGMSDNNSDTFSSPTGYVEGNAGSSGQHTRVAWFVACNIAATPNAKPTFTATNSDGANQIWAAQIVEFSGVKTSSCLDQHSTNNNITSGGVSTPFGAPSITPSLQNSVVFSYSSANATTGLKIVSPFASLNINFTSQDLSEFEAVTTNAAVQPTFECSSSCTFTLAIASTINVLSSTQPAVAGHHKLLMSVLPAIPFLWERGWIPAAMFRRRRDVQPEEESVP